MVFSANAQAQERLLLLIKEPLCFVSEVGFPPSRHLNPSNHDVTMQLFNPHCRKLVFIIGLCYGPHIIWASSGTTSIGPSVPFSLSVVTPTSIGICESRTINYITHNLPQVCRRYSRSDSTGLEPTLHATLTGSTGTETTSTSPGSTNSLAKPDQSTEQIGVSDLDADSALDDSTFLSFEDWKKQTLEKDGLFDPSTGDRRPQPLKDGDRRRSPDGIQDALKALEEDVVIDTDFTAFLGDHHNSAPTGSPREEKPTKSSVKETVDEKAADENRKFRSKDAGKTCKERFNFASLDAGGQIMKTNPEAKSASSLLKEDRDVYMLNTCQAKNKFLIVELSESILVETVAIANFEFFSSTFRQFSVSVSDRYPVKLDRWVDLGTYEARNSRDIQAFLVEDPRVWARYLRIEFLSHYGNEFYCPVSLLRVHGRTMIQDVLSMEELTRGEDEIEDGIENLNEGNCEALVPDTVTEVLEKEHRVTEGLGEAEAALEELVKTAEAVISLQRNVPLDSSQIVEVKRWLEDISMEQMTTPWIKGEPTITTLFDMSQRADTCLISDAPASLTANSREDSNDTTFLSESSQTDAPLEEPRVSSTPTGSLGVDTKDVTELQAISQGPMSSLSQDFKATGTISREPASSQITSAPSVTANWTAKSSSKSLNKNSPTPSSHSSQPTTQESFFKTVTKRLQLLETDSTISLKYIEEQSRILRDAFTKVEKRQVAKTNSFLENLNDTVLQELRKFSQQYDQIWQSTVIELETQRDQSQREIAAVSTRLSMLADELVFQKRMSIVQSVLLLLCLALVIFSRSSAGGYLDMPIIQNMVARSRNASDLPVDSASNSPTANRTGPPLERRAWLGPGHRRQRSDDSGGSLGSASRDYSPPTPFSSYSRQEENSKPDMEHDLFKGVRKRLIDTSLLKQDVPRIVTDSHPGAWQEPGVAFEEGDYPDFKNSALWLARDPNIPGSSYVRPDENATGSGEEDNSAHDTYRPRNLGAINSNANGLRTSFVGELPHLPSPPSNRDRPEFSIARKPLPALPKDDH